MKWQTKIVYFIGVKFVRLGNWMTGKSYGKQLNLVFDCRDEQQNSDLVHIPSQVKCSCEAQTGCFKRVSCDEG